MSLFFANLLHAESSQFEELSNWSIKRENNSYFLMNGDLKAKFSVNNVRPKVEKVEKLGESHVVVHYLAAVNGTSMMVNQTDGAIFDIKNKKFLGSYPRSYEIVSSRYPGAKIKQPVWENKEGKLFISEKEMGLNKTIDLEK